MCKCVQSNPMTVTAFSFLSRVDNLVAAAVTFIFPIRSTLLFVGSSGNLVLFPFCKSSFWDFQFELMWELNCGAQLDDEMMNGGLWGSQIHNQEQNTKGYMDHKIFSPFPTWVGENGVKTALKEWICLKCRISPSMFTITSVYNPEGTRARRGESRYWIEKEAWEGWQKKTHRSLVSEPWNEEPFAVVESHKWHSWEHYGIATWVPQISPGLCVAHKNIIIVITAILIFFHGGLFAGSPFPSPLLWLIDCRHLSSFCVSINTKAQSQGFSRCCIDLWLPAKLHTNILGAEEGLRGIPTRATIATFNPVMRGEERGGPCFYD